MWGRLSRPSRARGLKQEYGRNSALQQVVAPFTGAWIETLENAAE